MRGRNLCLLGATIALGSGLWLACGGSDGGTSDLTTTGDGGVPEGSSTANADTGVPPPNNDAATTPDASDAATAQPEAGGGDGGNPPDAGPGGTTTIISCGSTTCAIPAENCCVDRAVGGAITFACAATCPGPDAGVVESAALHCSGQSNCAAGTVCCVRQVPPNNSAASDCKAACGAKEAQLCSLSAAVSGCAATDAGTCSNANIGDWALPKTFATCGGKGN